METETVLYKGIIELGGKRVQDEMEYLAQGGEKIHVSSSKRIRAIYDSLYRRYGPQGWWPSDSELECVIGAILTQNTSWKNVEKALGNLKKARLLSIEKIDRAPHEEIASIIRSSGYFNQKAIKLKNFARFVIENYAGSLESMLGEEASTLRDRLLAINGIGPETADSIVLYAAHKPVFVVDAYTVRVLRRHRLVPEETSYDEVQELLTLSLPQDVELFNEFHALFVRVGKEQCKKKSPLCAGCPLEDDPHNP